MEKQPFDQTGLQALLEQLYQLPQAALDLEAQALRTDPAKWINDHFALDQEQANFLAQMPAQSITFLGDQGSFAVANRLPILLEQQPENRTNGDKPDKYFDTKSSLSSGTNSKGETTAEGQLTIEVTYS